MKLIRVKGRFNGITLSSGKLLYKEIATAILDGESVTLDFVNQDYLTAVFLNASIGYLYAYFKEDIIGEKLCIVGEKEGQDKLITRVLKHSSNYWNNENMKEITDAVIAMMSEEMSR